MTTLPGQTFVESLAAWQPKGIPLTPSALQAWHAQCGYMLPPRWWALVAAYPTLQAGPWTAEWATPTPARPWAPNALVALRHADGGCLALDIDPDDQTHWCAWWVDTERVTLVGHSWQQAAPLLALGPEAFLPALDRLNHAPTPRSADDMPSTALGWAWLDALPPKVQLWSLDNQGQTLGLQGLIARHPRLPWFATKP